ncbi:MAG: hypothetical protein R2771_08125 [Saprospiraceae bacterium]
MEKISVKYFFILSLFFILSYNANADCGINELIISNVECQENTNYSFSLNFAISNPQPDSFEILVNGSLYGIFSIDELPITVVQSSFSGNETDHIIVRDRNNYDCYQEAEVLNPCDCSLFNLQYTKFNCNNDSFYIKLDFDHSKTGESFCSWNDRYIFRLL